METITLGDEALEKLNVNSRSWVNYNGRNFAVMCMNSGSDPNGGVLYATTSIGFAGKKFGTVELKMGESLM